MNSIHIRGLVSQEGCIELRIPQQYHGKMLISLSCMSLCRKR